MAMQVKELWGERSMVARVSIITSLSILILLTVLAIYWALSVPKGVLFKDLEPQSAAGIVSGLERLKIDYELTDEGKTVLVDQDIVHDTRLKLMSSGVQLSGGVGFEIFDETEFGMTEFTQRINFQRALQGELSRTIAALDEVKHARVHLVLPERSLFRKEQEQPTASVILFIKGNESLSAEQITGIQRLVAASVPVLKESMVTVLNAKGVTLSRTVVKDKGVGIEDLRLERKKEIEKYLVKKVSSILQQSVGSGESVVSVDVVLNYDKIRTTNETVVPNKDGSQVVLRKHESRSEGEGQQSKKSRLVNSEIEYKYGRVVEQVVNTPGSIKRMSIGVLITREISNQNIEKIKDLVIAATGLEVERGDMISVKSIKQDNYTSNKQQSGYIDNKANIENAVIGHDQDALIATQDTPDDFSRNGRSYLDQMREKIGKKNLAYLAIFIVASLAIALLVYYSQRLRKQAFDSEIQQLSDQERERVLKLLQEWLSSEKELKEEEVSS